MILLLIPVAAIFVGLGLWGAMRGLGVMNVLGADSTGGGRGRAPGAGRGARYERERATSVREWLSRISPGWLVAIIAVAAVWILGWLIALIVGISFLS